MHMAVRWLLLSLVESVRGGTCELLSCGTDRLLRSNPEIATPLFRLEICSLIGNDIGTHGARVISDCLATNPVIKVLELSVKRQQHWG